jgi:hypothetical protein
MQVARKTVLPHGIVFFLIRDCGQIGKAEPLVVVTTTWAFEAFVPSKVTDGGVTMQEAPAGRPEQPNTTTRLNPPLGVTETAYVADCPGLTVFPLGPMETEKSAVFPAAGETDCKACTRSRRPLPMPAPSGTA